jgi:hypothetical protein
MRLATPMDTPTLKAWLESINFNGSLKSEMRLTDSQIGLHFPLDRTVSSPSKLIYIAPPKLVGFADSVGPSIKFVVGKDKAITPRAFTPIGHDQLRDHINTLRRAVGLPDQKYNLVMHRGMEVLTGAEESVVHDITKSGESYLRFNLNGGDSLAYYINLRDPGIIGNHKGEPYLYTREVAPDLFKTLTKAAKALPGGIRNSETVEPMAFYATNRNSMVYIGTYDRATDVLRIDPSNETAAKSWLLSFGIPPTVLPHYDVVTDMTSDVRYEPGYPIINLYRQTDFMKEYADQERTLDEVKEFSRRCPVLWKTLVSVHGNELKAVEYFVNWLAAVFQERRLTKTAWVWHGTQGTGKGMLIENLLRPLFGEQVVKQVTYTLINDKFNGFMDGTLILNIDEADLSHSMDRTELRSKLFNWIAEPSIAIRDLHKSETWVENRCNMIFTSNSSTKPVQIEAGDRRFNVAERQDERLMYTANEYAVLATGEELPAFAELLGQWKIQEQWLLQPYGGAAKSQMYEGTHSLTERIARAIREGDTAFFIESRPSPLQLQSDLIGKPLPIGPYDELLRAMLDGTLTALTRQDLYVLFRVVVGHNDRVFSDNNAEQRRTFQKLALLPGRKEGHRDGRTGKSVNGIKAATWDTSEDTQQLAQELFDSLPKSSSNVVPLHK